jgi:DNA-binding transcriptional regulator GbsR (MarR family)
MSEEKVEYGLQQFNAADLLKRNTVTQVFKTLDDACQKQETISEENFETSFTKRVDLVEGLLWKYTPPEIRNIIKGIHQTLEQKLKEIDNNPSLSNTNKLLTKKNISYEYNVEIFKLLEVVLTNSPISVEYADMEIRTEDFAELAKSIRNKDIIKLFTEIG